MGLRVPSPAAWGQAAAHRISARADEELQQVSGNRCAAMTGLTGFLDRRSPVFARRAMASYSSPLVTRVGLRVLEQGGHAAAAAAAVAMAGMLAMAELMMIGLSGNPYAVRDGGGGVCSGDLNCQWMASAQRSSLVMPSRPQE